MSERYRAYDKLLIERPLDGILKITFNRPESYNSVDAETHTQITHIWRDIDADPTVRCVIVTGAGKAFSAGGDFSLVEVRAKDKDLRHRLLAMAQKKGPVCPETISCRNSRNPCHDDSIYSKI